MPACFDHCGLLQGNGGGASKVGGHTYHQVLADWFFERDRLSHTLVDACGDAGCNPTCPLHPPSPPGGCTAVLQKDCPGLKGEGGPCMQCVESHAAPKGCSRADAQQWCYGTTEGGATAGAGAAGMALTLLPGKAWCLDGSPAVYYLSRNTSSDTWVIYLQGGGGCGTQKDCADRAKKELGSSSKWPASLHGAQTYSPDCGVNPDFCRVNRVFVKYCSADGHRGQRAVASEETWGFRFAGHTNFKAIVAALKADEALAGAARVLLTGCSAGGTGTLSNANTLKELLPGVDVRASPIGGWFFAGSTADHPSAAWSPPSSYANFTAGIATPPSEFLAAIRPAIKLHDVYLLPECVAAHTDEPAVCYSAHVYAPFVSTPLLVAENMMDSHQITVTFGMYTEELRKPSGRAYVTYWAQAMVASTAPVARRDASGLFVPACFHHCEMCTVGERSQEASIAGHTYSDVLGDWFYDRGAVPHVLVDNVTAEFNPSCPLYIPQEKCLFAMRADCPGLEGEAGPCMACVSRHTAPEGCTHEDAKAWCNGQ